MSRPVRVLITSASIAVAALARGLRDPEDQRPAVGQGRRSAGAVLFSQRCSGCHTLSYAGDPRLGDELRDRAVSTTARTSTCAASARSTRVLYAIENGGFSGADHAPERRRRSGRDRRGGVRRQVRRAPGARSVPGSTPCQRKPIGTLPTAPNAPRRPRAPAASTVQRDAPSTSAIAAVARQGARPSAKAKK